MASHAELQVAREGALRRDAQVEGNLNQVLMEHLGTPRVKREVEKGIHS